MTLFPAATGDVARRLCACVAERVEASGAVRSPCQGRVLETALLLALLERTGAHRVAWQRAHRFLAAHLNAAEPLDRLLARAALRATPSVSTGLVEEFLRGAPAFMTGRKRATVHAILTVLGVDTGPAAAALNTAGVNDLHTWARVQTTAVAMILARRTVAGSATEVELLRSTQTGPAIWEGNLLVHLLILHALVDQPGCGDLVAAGVGRAVACQREDGGVPFVTDVDTWTTVTAGVALAGARACPATLHRLAGHLLVLQRASGWSCTDTATLTDVDDTSVAVEALHLIDRHRYAPDVERGLRALLRYQGRDGGFPTYQPGAPSEAGMTAAAVNALSVRSDRYWEQILAGRRYLLRAQREDGLFEPDWSRSRFHCVFRAVLALDTAGPGTSDTLDAVGRGIKAVASTQNLDGGWGQQPGEPTDAISTAYALGILCHQDDPASAIDAVTVLLAAQREDGGIDSVPDMLGTRPFLYTIPALADHFTLLALAHLDARLTTTLFDDRQEHQ